MQRVLDKIPLERLRDKKLRVSLLCPRCVSSRISLGFANSSDTWRSVACPKCGADIMLDSLSLVVLLEKLMPTSDERQTSAAQSPVE